MNYNFLLPLIVVLGLTIILVTTFTVVDNSGPQPQATPAPSGPTTVTSGTTTTTAPAVTTTPAPTCPVATQILAGITGPVVLTAGGFFRYEQFRDYSNNLVLSALPPSITTYYPITPPPPLQVTAATEYLGDLYLTLKDVPVLFSLSTGARGIVVAGYMHGYTIKNDFIYGAVDDNLLMMNPATASLQSFVPMIEQLYSLSVNPNTGTAYALQQDGDIVEISLSTGSTTPTCLSATNYTSISFDSLGRLFAFKEGSIDRFPTAPIS
jgi:hypothetical protein